MLGRCHRYVDIKVKVLLELNWNGLVTAVAIAPLWQDRPVVGTGLRPLVTYTTERGIV